VLNNNTPLFYDLRTLLTSTVSCVAQIALLDEKLRDYIVDGPLRSIVSLMVNPRNDREVRSAAEDVLKNLGFNKGFENFETCGFDFEILRDWYLMRRSLKPQRMAEKQVQEGQCTIPHPHIPPILYRLYIPPIPPKHPIHPIYPIYPILTIHTIHTITTIPTIPPIPTIHTVLYSLYTLYTPYLLYTLYYTHYTPYTIPQVVRMG
jgi:hypothetical protein